MSPTLSELYQKYANWLRARARTMGTSDPEEIAQQAFLRVVSSKRQKEIESPQAFLATVASNLLLDASRKVRTQGGVPAALDEIQAPNMPWVAPDQESALLLKQVILGLPPIYRDTFILNRFIGLTYAEIARRQGVTVKAVEYRISRALALCQEALRD